MDPAQFNSKNLQDKRLSEQLANSTGKQKPQRPLSSYQLKKGQQASGYGNIVGNTHVN